MPCRARPRNAAETFSCQGSNHWRNPFRGQRVCQAVVLTAWHMATFGQSGADPSDLQRDGVGLHPDAQDSTLAG